MCRLIGYLGNPIQLDELLYKQEHSLYKQSYNPLELKSGAVCADGFGVGWYDKAGKPFIYRNTNPLWNDPNLEELSNYVQSTCTVGYARLAGIGEALDISNCQPFRSGKLLFVHNGEILNFQQTLYRPIRESLSDATYQLIKGMTDSEHIFALLVETWQSSPDSTLLSALRGTLQKLTKLASEYNTSFSTNLIVSDGQAVAAIRYAYRTQAPTLYWSCDAVKHPNQVIVASERLSNQNWTAFPEQSMLFVQAESLQPTITLLEKFA
ncbi:ergothioneine biosynthesis protein EgtC [Nostocaceae cyanobacterium CENA357]|uniref:Ergothioneine biosynthesis protein EgtC n=1 Tax=Atlanticothrix silvestris CENA357 TaxID=1725252 RepID=A0A8J7HF57_9CYAN|nr:ergothioneine biosynthesis protein EgtC [Atlanticothrix silvestris]MBH8551764.1 ergothioneine biosynthesis protein EgtC [Atlanticothrix silvestris CENA357]